MTMDLSFSFRFQSALPQGERRFIQATITRSMDFNPRSRRGTTAVQCVQFLNEVISIRAPAGGATLRDFEGLSPEEFQSALPQGGETKNETHNYPTEIISIRAPAGGETCNIQPETAAKLVFQSALPQGERLQFWT